MKARNFLSTHLPRDSPLFDIYLTHLLETIISKGDVGDSQVTRQADVELAAREIAELLQPLALLASHNKLADDADLDDEIAALFRDAWYNIVVHGFATTSGRGQKHMNE